MEGWEEEDCQPSTRRGTDPEGFQPGEKEVEGC